jgi:hypothetical protein
MERINSLVSDAHQEPLAKQFACGELLSQAKHLAKNTA